MPISKLSNPPLIEAIFELRWKLKEKQPGIYVDPLNKIFPGKFYSKIESEYPFYQELPASEMPDEISAYTIQHRFRKEENRWPLIQLGPGIVTLNNITNYEWSDFEQRIGMLIDSLLAAYPDKKSLNFNDILLRYIDAYEFDFNKNNILEFLHQKMKIKNEITEELVEGISDLNKIPIVIDLRYSFPILNPEGLLNVRFTRGDSNGKSSLIWETVVQLKGSRVPQNKGDIMDWISSAHGLTHKWFFNLIKGDLLEEFK